MPTTETASTATALLVKATIRAAKWAGVARRRALATTTNTSDDDRDAEITFLRDRVERLDPVPRSAKTTPPKIEQRHFAEARVTGFRLPRAA